LDVVGGAVFGAIGGMIRSFPLGPAGLVAGALTGAFYGASMAVAKEGAEGLAEITHPELFSNN